MALIVIEPITARDVSLFRATRLRALQDVACAFRSTYEREYQFSDADWNQRLERWSGEWGIGFLAMEEDAACGIAGSLLNAEDPSRAQLVSMWMAPTHRRCGVRRMLVNGVLVWARSREVRDLDLMVTSNNEPAMRFYERLAFTRTGRTEPYTNDPAVIEYEMSRATQ